MKLIILTCSLLFMSVVFASPSYMVGYGRSSQFCSANDFSCQSFTKRLAEDQGRRDVLSRCQGSGGIMTSATCNTMCSPSFMPINAPPTMVSCTATCSGLCDRD